MNKNLEGIKKVCQRMVGECADFIVGTYTLQVRNNDLMVRTKSGYMQVAQLSENIQNEILHKCSTGTKSNTKRDTSHLHQFNASGMCPLLYFCTFGIYFFLFNL